VAQVLTARAAGRLGAARASATTFIIPPVALALGVVVRSEPVAWISIVGCACCLAGAWLIQQKALFARWNGRSASSRCPDVDFGQVRSSGR
jgi:drug/metabolite transporter (DMT)-like permease